MDDLLKNLTDKQTTRLCNYSRGYSYNLVRNRTIIYMLLETDLSPNDLAGLKDSDIPTTITPRLKRQISKFKRIRRIFFYDTEQFDYFFLDGDQKPLTSKAVEKILYDALKFANNSK